VKAPVVLAVDGGNSKTDLALVQASGDVLALVRGAQSSPHHLGVDGCLEVLAGLRAQAMRQAGPAAEVAEVADEAQLLLAGVDFPSEELEVQRAVAARGWAARVTVSNDTFAVLRAGTERGWGVAVVCGAGINCVGVAPDGRVARFPALGAITGDWGGGYDVGLASLSAAARSEDGRGPRTSLERVVPAYFGLASPSRVAEEIHGRHLPMSRVVELAPIVFSEAASDRVAGEIVDRLAAEVTALARAALVRLELTGEPVDVLLGGGLLQAGDGRLLDAIRAGLQELGPAIAVHRPRSQPIVGAALLGLDYLGAGPEAQHRLREQLSAAVARVEDDAAARGDLDTTAAATSSAATVLESVE
jgi:N-acetylglucosamine kinase-like BadF-type ATPase